MKENRIGREGFSLIEVIVAVAILAVLSMPILLYFTNSAIHTANGKKEQAADMAAQSVVEEIDSIDRFDWAEQYLLTSGAGWEMVSGPATGPVASTVMKRPITVNGTDFVAVATINYGKYNGETIGSATGASVDYNAYDNPHFSELYSGSSAVISEKDQTETGHYTLFHELYSRIDWKTVNAGTEAKSAVEDALLERVKHNTTRKIVLTVKDGGTDFLVSGSYQFSYDDGSSAIPYKEGASKQVSTEVYIRQTRIAKDKLKNIYFLFKPTYAKPTEETAELDFSALSTEEAKNLSVSFIGQTPTTEEVADGMVWADSYKIKFNYADVSRHSMAANYYANSDIQIPDATNPDSAEVFDLSPGLLGTSKDKRIAYVTVEVYYADDVSGNVLATNTTTKAI